MKWYMMITVHISLVFEGLQLLHGIKFIYATGLSIVADHEEGEAVDVKEKRVAKQDESGTHDDEPYKVGTTGHF